MSRFQFKKFTINQSRASLKVGTDAMILGASIQTESPRYALDIGAGTGVLSLMIAQNHSNLIVDAIEIDENSFLDLESNVFESVFSHQIQLFNTNFFLFESDKSYDLIFSNPPFFDDGVKFSDSIEFHSKHNVNFPKLFFFQKCAKLLAIDGEIWIIVPFNKSHLWIEAALQSNLLLIKQIIVEAKPQVKIRSILVFSNSKRESIDVSSFVIRDSKGFYTHEYHVLTKEFHIKTPLK